MKRGALAVGLLLVLVGCSSPPDHLGTVMQFQEHKNNGDLEATLALFSEEPSLDFGPLGTISGMPEVRAILEYDLALNTHLQFQDCREDGAEVICRVIETNKWLKTAQIESVEYEENRFAFAADGRISSVSATFTAESAQLLGAAIAGFHQWATANRPEEYSELFSEQGAFVYSAENAEKVLTLLSAWRGE